jgi:hypothetical protein
MAGPNANVSKDPSEKTFNWAHYGPSRWGGYLSLGSLALLLLIVIIWLTSNVDRHFLEQLNGFWIGSTPNGQCILYLDHGQLRLIESNELVSSSSMEKGSYEIASKTVWNMDMRTYKLRIAGLKGKSEISKQLTQKEVLLDLYPIEGTCIIYDGAGDILTLVKDNKSGLALMI